MSQTSMIYLPGYKCQLNEDGALHSETKVKSVAVDLSEIVGISESLISTIPSTSEETVGYRCSNTFQIIAVEPKDPFSRNSDKDLQYAMRTLQKAVPLGGEYFPIATARIQHVMKLIIHKLNLKDEDSGDRQSRQTGSTYTYQRLRNNLASISFASSWNDGGDCIVTMNFSKPISDQSGDYAAELTSQGNQFCRDCLITTLVLRSKKKKLVFGREPLYINDTIHVGMDGDGQFQISLDDGDGKPLCNLQTMSPVHYRKPEDAFQHPNSNTMLQALFWMLNRLKLISEIELEDAEDRNKKLHMLEMYCGCGAHTAAISKTGLFSNIVAVELDQRLVDACKENMINNGAAANVNDDCQGTKQISISPVYVFQGDASEWASKILLEKDNSVTLSADMSSKKYWYSQNYHVLLVDPPRSGLGKQVCDLALRGSFKHIIYISCGKDALKEDIRVLKESFDVADCVITDLFPRTTSVETLIHLKRRK